MAYRIPGLVPEPQKIFLSSLGFVVALYLVSSILAFFTLDLGVGANIFHVTDMFILRVDGDVNQLVTRTIFGYIWYETFGWLEFCIKWGGTAVVLGFNVVFDLFMEWIVQTVFNAIGSFGTLTMGGLPLLGELSSWLLVYDYPGITVDHLIQFFQIDLHHWFFPIRAAGELLGVIPIALLQGGG